MDETQTLIKQSQAGDAESVNKLIKTYENLIFNIIRKKNYFVADGELDDLLQVGRVALYSAITTYDEKKGAKFHTYAKILIDRHLQNFIKKSNNQNNKMLSSSLRLSPQGELKIDDDCEERSIPFISKTHATPEEHLIENENIKNLLRELKTKLSNFEQEIIELSMKGYTYTEIAKILKKTEKSIDNGLTRIRKKSSTLKE